MANLKVSRDLFLLDPNVVFLNHGSFGATPKTVFDDYQRWQLELERQPVEFIARRSKELLQQARAVLARYLNAGRDDVVFVTNATAGLNTIARSLILKPGDEVLTSDHEYGAIDRTWKFLAEKRGFIYRRLALPIPVTSHTELVERFCSAMGEKTRILTLSHITSPTGLVFPVHEICRQARARGILTVIDGAHAPGHIPLDLQAIGCDFYTGNLHKWLLTPKGCAFMYARPEVQRLIEPLIVSWGWQAEEPGPSKYVDYLEYQGTRDLAAFLAAPAAIAFQEKWHWHEVAAGCRELALKAQRAISEISAEPPLFTDARQWLCQMVACALPAKTDVKALKTRLYDSYRIEVPVYLWNTKPLLRVSVQAYNTWEEIQLLCKALAEVIPAANENVSYSSKAY